MINTINKDKTPEQLGEDILNIIKGANMKLKMFTAEGQKTTEAEEATRFYAYEEDPYDYSTRRGWKIRNCNTSRW